MGILSVSLLIVGVALSFHETLWGWSALFALGWVVTSLIERKYNPELWN